MFDVFSHKKGYETKMNTAVDRELSKAIYIKETIKNGPNHFTKLQKSRLSPIACFQLFHNDADRLFAICH